MPVGKRGRAPGSHATAHTHERVVDTPGLRLRSPVSGPEVRRTMAASKALDDLERTGRHAALVWLASMAGAAGAALHFGTQPDYQMTQFAFGLLLAGYGTIAMAIAGRLETLATIVVLALGLAFAVWFTVWVEAAVDVVHPWLTQIGLEQFGNVTTIPAAVASFGCVAAAVLYLATGSSRVVLQVGLLSVASGMAFASPVYANEIALAGALLWHAGTSASLLQWAMSMHRVRAGFGCPACAADLSGTNTRSCPRCGLHLASSDSAVEHGLAAIEAAQRPPARRPL